MYNITVLQQKTHIKNFYGWYKIKAIITNLWTLCVTIEQIPPVITKDPIDINITLVNNYTNVSLTCKANGASSYIWEKHNSVIPSDSTGVKTNILNLVNLQPQDAGNYRCVAINGTGSSKSHYAMVAVLGKWTGAEN